MPHTTSNPVLVGRSSSHFTRVCRVFALELGVAHTFEVVRDLTSANAADYADNPALRLPILKCADSTWFGALNACRQLARLGAHEHRVVWPEDLVSPSCANAQELTLQGMASEVTLIMLRATSGDRAVPYADKLLVGIRQMLAWLDAHVDQALAELPGDRQLSFLEVSLYCWIAHLPFREVAPLDGYPALTAFQTRLERRPSIEATPYRFDS